MTPDEYLLAVGRALRSDEKSVEDDTKALLLLMLWRLRQALIASLPDTGIFREQVLISLLLPFSRELTDYGTRFRSILLTRLEQVDREHPVRAAAFANVPLTRWVYAPRIGDELMRTTRSAGTTLYDLFAINPETGTSKYADNYLRTIRTKLLTGIMRGDSTIEIARGIVAERTRRGYVQPINARGTLFSALRNRDTALIANAIWDVRGAVERRIFTRQERRTATTETPFAPNGWIWKATLDPRTCPVCRPLHNTRSDKYNGFPYVPPVHPRCRCAILPAP